MPAADIQVKITYFDTAMALIEINGLRLLTDPVLDPAGTCFEYGPIRLDKLSSAATTAADLGAIDAVLLSHDQHGDNLDHAGRALLAAVPRVITTPLAAGRLGHPGAVGLDPWESTTLHGASGRSITVTAMPAQHGPDGTQEATGPVTGFLIDWAGAPGPIYISGDTVPFAGTHEIVDRIARPWIALPHLGSVQLAPLGDALLSMSAAQAIDFMQALDAPIIVPLHFDGWGHFSEDSGTARALTAASPIADRFHWLAPGESLTIDG